MEGGRVKGKAEVKGGKDGDELTVRGGARIGGRLILTTGKKNDVIIVNNASVGGGLEVSSGGGNDQITVQFSTIDPGRRLRVPGRRRQRQPSCSSASTSDRLELELGGGDDDVAVQDCDFDGEIFADGGDGEDEADLSGENSFDLSERRRVVNFEDFD